MPARTRALPGVTRVQARSFVMAVRLGGPNRRPELLHAEAVLLVYFLCPVRLNALAALPVCTLRPRQGHAPAAQTAPTPVPAVPHAMAAHREPHRPLVRLLARIARLASFQLQERGYAATVRRVVTNLARPHLDVRCVWLAHTQLWLQ